jgi:hypothetical protein
LAWQTKRISNRSPNNSVTLHPLRSCTCRRRGGHDNGVAGSRKDALR